jgi:stage IV sporulation protein FB
VRPNESTSSPFTLRFRLLGTTIRVSPWFWLFGAIFGYFYMLYREQATGEDLGWKFVALWIGWLFVSTLVHDLGHIVTARMAGRRGQIDFGGQPSWDTPAERRWQRIAIAAAGPGAGLLFYGLVLLIRSNDLPFFKLGFLKPHAVMIAECLEMLVFLNLFWNLLNLVPIWPLDGGEIALEVFSGISPANGYRVALGLSALLAAGAAAYSVLVYFRPELPYLKALHPSLKGIHPGIMAFFVGLMAIQNIQMLVQAERERRGESDARPTDDDWR